MSRRPAAILDRAAEGGIDFIDTLRRLSLGGDLTTRGLPRKSSVAGRREAGPFHRGHQVLARPGQRLSMPAIPASTFLAAVDASLRRLQTDYN